MSHIVQTDAQGALVLPAGLAPPNTAFTVEAERWWATTTPAERVAWLDDWIRSLPPAPPLSIEATRRDSIYE